MWHKATRRVEDIFDCAVSASYILNEVCHHLEECTFCIDAQHTQSREICQMRRCHWDEPCIIPSHFVYCIRLCVWCTRGWLTWRGDRLRHFRHTAACGVRSRVHTRRRWKKELLMDLLRTIVCMIATNTQKLSFKYGWQENMMYTSSDGCTNTNNWNSHNF